MKFSDIPILPPAYLAVLGGGQLGMYFLYAAKRMGYKTILLDPNPNTPAARYADIHMINEFDDHAALENLGKLASAVSIESESVPNYSLEFLMQYTRVSPDHNALRIMQDRFLEKEHLNSLAINTAKYLLIDSAEDINIASNLLPGILKTRTLGYDGKCQHNIKSVEELKKYTAQYGYGKCILEELLDLSKEISIISYSNEFGHKFFELAENVHVNGILLKSTIPADISKELAEEAKSISHKIVDSMCYIGVLCVEMFIVDNKIIVNELAPRPHNSGHYTMDAYNKSQFDAQVLSLAGLEIPKHEDVNPIIMRNLLGDIWIDNKPNFRKLLASKHAKLYIYGKEEFREKRKMGHYTVCGVKDPKALSELEEDLYKSLFNE